MTPHEEQRAFSVFETALEEYRRQHTTFNARDAMQVALRAAFVDYESRMMPAERVARVEKPRELLKQNRKLIDAVCADTGTRVFSVCSFDRAAGAEVDARGILVGILTDAGLLPREIAEGLGMSASTVANLKTLRRDRAEWEPKILQFASLFGQVDEISTVKKTM